MTLPSLFGAKSKASERSQHSLIWMIELEYDKNASADFRMAAMRLREAKVRSEVVLQQIDAPKNLARHALAFTCDIAPGNAGARIDLGTGRLVLLWDDAPQENWDNNFRIIVFAKSPLETDIGFNDESSDLPWAWMMDGLRHRGASFSAEAGTTTRVISVGHGSIAAQPAHAELELRASWCPTDNNMAAHLEAWQDLICLMSGLSLHGEEIPSIERRA